MQTKTTINVSTLTSLFLTKYICLNLSTGASAVDASVTLELEL